MKRMMIAGCCVLASFCAVAQDGAPAGLAKRAESAPTAKPEPVDPALELWCQTLAKKLADAQPAIRSSAEAALLHVGKPAIGTLTALSTGSDKALADAAKKLIDRINRGPQRGPGGFQNAMDDLAKELKLDEAKTQKLKDLQKASMDKIRETMESVRSGDMTFEEAREERKVILEDAKKDLRKFLSEDEAKKVDEAVQRMWQGGMGGRRGPDGGGEGGGERRRRREGGGGGDR